MSGPNVTLRRADEGTVRYVEHLLRRNDLPAADVGSNPDRFFIATDGGGRAGGDRVGVGGDRVGVGGIEAYGAHGLLRSVVVEESVRGRGYGAALCRALEEVAREEGVRTLTLLTTTAEEFFAERGYVPVDRESVPEAIRGTSQFVELCPASAACLHREL